MSRAGSQRPNLGDILKRLQLIDEEQVQAALTLQKETGRLFGECLIELGFTGEDDVSWALSSQLGLPFVAAEATMADPDLLAEFPRDFLRRNLVLPLVASEDELSVVLADPTDQVSLARLRRISGRRLNVAVGTSTAIRAVLDEVLGAARDSAEGSDPAEAPLGGEGTATPSLSSPELTRLLDRAFGEGANAVFLDTEDKKVHVRFRTADGLKEGGQFDPRAMAEIEESLTAWLGPGETPLPGVRRWGGDVDAADPSPVRALAINGRAGVSVSLILDSDGQTAEKLAAPFESEWERLDTLLKRPRGLVAAVAPSARERAQLLTRMVGRLELSGRRAWVLAPSDTHLPKRFACYPTLGDGETADTFANLEGVGALAGSFGSLESVAALAEAAVRDRLVVAVFPGSSALGFLARALERNISCSLLGESLLAVAAGRSLPGADGTTRAVSEILFVDRPLRRALQDGGRMPRLRSAAAAQGFVEMAERARALENVDPTLLLDLDRHRYLEEAA